MTKICKKEKCGCEDGFKGNLLLLKSRWQLSSLDNTLTLFMFIKICFKEQGNPLFPIPNSYIRDISNGIKLQIQIWQQKILNEQRQQSTKRDHLSLAHESVFRFPGQKSVWFCNRAKDGRSTTQLCKHAAALARLPLCQWNIYSSQHLPEQKVLAEKLRGSWKNSDTG